MEQKPIAFSIRQALPKDAPSLAALVREAALSDSVQKESLTETQGRIEGCLQNCGDGRECNIFVVEDGAGGVIAYAAIQWHTTLFLPGNEGYISEVTVKADERGRGIGGLLLDKLVEEGKRRDCARMSLINSRFRESYKREFYTKRGWQEREVAANFILEL